MKLLEKAINNYIALDPEAPEKLTAFDGKQICIEVLGLNKNIYLFVQGAHIDVMQDCDIEPDTVISGTPAALLKLGVNRDAAPLLFAREIEIRGDVRLGRQFKALRRDVEDGGDQGMLVVFSHPSDIRGTTYLVRKHPGRDDDRWLFLPGLDLVKRISAGDKRTSFVGSHSFYEDVSGRWLEDDNHELMETTDQHYVLRHVPKDPQAVEFADYTTWIDRETFIPMKTEYRKPGGEVYRVVEVLEVGEFQAIPTVTYCRISDLESGGKTEIKLRWAEYDQGLPEAIFSEKSLRNPPARWLTRNE